MPYGDRDAYSGGRRGNSTPPLGRETTHHTVVDREDFDRRRGVADVVGGGAEVDQEYVVILPPRAQQRPANRNNSVEDVGGGGGRERRDEDRRVNNDGAVGRPRRDQDGRYHAVSIRGREEFERRIERREMPETREQPAAGYHRNDELRRPRSHEPERRNPLPNDPPARQPARVAPTNTLDRNIPPTNRNTSGRQDWYDDDHEAYDSPPAANVNRRQQIRHDPPPPPPPSQTNDLYSIREPRHRRNVEEQSDELYYDYAPVREERTRVPPVEHRSRDERNDPVRRREDFDERYADERPTPQQHQQRPELVYERAPLRPSGAQQQHRQNYVQEQNYDNPPQRQQRPEPVYDQASLRPSGAQQQHRQNYVQEQNYDSPHQRQQHQQRQDPVYDEIPLRAPAPDLQQRRQQPVRHVHYQAEPVYDNQERGGRGSDRQQIYEQPPRQAPPQLDHHYQEEEQPLRRQQQQHRQQLRAPEHREERDAVHQLQRRDYEREEVFYDELPLESSENENQQRLHHRQQQPPINDYEILPRDQTIFDEPQPVRQHQEPPSANHQQQEDSRIIYDEPPQRQNAQGELANDDSYSNASTVLYSASVVGENREREVPEVHPRQERVVAAARAPSPIQVQQRNPTLQWNVRQITPRVRDRENSIHVAEDAAEVPIVEFPPDELAIIDANDDWDSEPIPVARPQVQQDFSNHSGRGGGRGGAMSGNNYQGHQQSATGDEFENSGSYRPPSGRGGFNNRGGGGGGFSGYGRRDYDQDNFNDLGRRNFVGGQNSGGGGYSGYQPQGYEMGERSRAPKDYVPHQRVLADIYNEDRAELDRHGNTIFEGDAEIEVEGDLDRQHCDNWNDMSLDPRLVENIRESEYIKPRNIQKSCIPYIQEGFDIKCQAETGSGKTVAFLLPIIDSLITSKENGLLYENGPYALIIAPTRELVYQLYEQAMKLTRNTDISVACAYGQYSVQSNISHIRSGCNILVACVGRLLDLVDRGAVKLNLVKFLVLDEPDRLLRDFFDGCEILKVLKHGQLAHKTDRQTMLFSATLSDPAVQTLDEFLNLENLISIAAKNESNTRIEYLVLAIPSRPSKFRYLTTFLKDITAANNDVCPKVLVFINRRIDIERVAVDITREGFPATTIHGGRAQDLREEAFSRFKEGKARVLVATDVCARGVDIYSMDYVINYDLPPDKTTFLQRCGRTGRTHRGVAVSFYCEETDLNMAHVINEVIEGAGQIPPAFLRSSVEASDYRYGTGYGGNDAAPAQQYGQQRGNGFGEGRGNDGVAGGGEGHQQQPEENDDAVEGEDWN